MSYRIGTKLRERRIETMKGKMLGIGLLLVFTAYGYAEISKRGLLGPAVSTTSANNHITGGQDVVYAAGASGVRNCLDSVDAIATSAYILRVLDGGTTIYQLTLGANVGVVR